MIPSTEISSSSEFKNKTRSLIEQMVKNQLQLNTTAYSDSWIEKSQSGEWDYDIAASQEIAEFINSFWLPWWSKAEQDMANCRIELVDALHFMLSSAISMMQQRVKDIEDSPSIDHVIEMTTGYIHESLFEALDSWEFTHQQTLDFAKGLQISICGGHPSYFIDFFFLCYSIDFDIEKLFALYMGKSELNKFRQDKGYKQGLYKKKWDGVNEDNYFLSLWVGEQDVPPTALMIRAFLETEYVKYQ